MRQRQAALTLRFLDGPLPFLSHMVGQLHGLHSDCRMDSEIGQGAADQPAPKMSHLGGRTRTRLLHENSSAVHGHNAQQDKGGPHTFKALAFVLLSASDRCLIHWEMKEVK
jgi:hypothetical protein